MAQSNSAFARAASLAQLVLAIGPSPRPCWCFVSYLCVQLTLTDKYVVYEYCGEVTVRFSDDEFFNKVKNSLVDHYPPLGRHLTGAAPAHFVTDQCGHDVRLQRDVTVVTQYMTSVCQSVMTSVRW